MSGINGLGLCMSDKLGMSLLDASLSLPLFPPFTSRQLVEDVHIGSRPCASTLLDLLNTMACRSREAVLIWREKWEGDFPI